MFNQDHKSVYNAKSWLSDQNNAIEARKATIKLLHAINILPSVPMNVPKNKIEVNEINGSSNTIENIFYFKAKLRRLELRTFGLTDQRSASEL